MADIEITTRVQGAAEAKQQIDSLNKSIGDTGKQADSATKPLGDAGKAAEDAGANFGIAALAVNNFGKIAAGIAATAVVTAAGIAKLAQPAIQAAAAIADMSTQFGMSAENISRWQYVAEVTGTKTRTVTSAFQALTKSIAQAGQDVESKAAKAFRSLNDEALNLAVQSGNTNKVMLRLAEVFKNMPDGPQKTAAAMALMNNAGADMVPVLNKGEAALLGLHEEADDFSLTVKQDFADAAKQLSEDAAKLSKSFGGWRNVLAEGVTPALQAVVSEFLITTRNSEVLVTAAKGLVLVFKGLTTGFLYTVNVLEKVGLAFELVKKTADALGSGSFKAIPGIFRDYSDAVTDADKRLQEYNDKIWASNDAARDGADAQKDLAESTKKSARELALAEESAEEYGKRWAGLLKGTLKDVRQQSEQRPKQLQTEQKALKSAGESAEEYGKRMYELARRAYPAATQSTEEWAEEMADLSRELLRGMETAEEYGQRMADLARRGFPEATQSTEEWAEAQAAAARNVIEENQRMRDSMILDFGDVKEAIVGKDALIDTVKEFSRSFGKAVSDILFDGGSLRDKLSKIFEELARNIIAAIASMIAEWLVWKALTSAGFEIGAPDFLKSTATSTAGKLAGSALASGGANALGQTVGLAGGGTVATYTGAGGLTTTLPAASTTGTAAGTALTAGSTVAAGQLIGSTAGGTVTTFTATGGSAGGLTTTLPAASTGTNIAAGTSTLAAATPALAFGGLLAVASINESSRDAERARRDAVTQAWMATLSTDDLARVQEYKQSFSRLLLAFNADDALTPTANTTASPKYTSIYQLASMGLSGDALTAQLAIEKATVDKQIAAYNSHIKRTVSLWASNYSDFYVKKKLSTLPNPYGKYVRNLSGFAQGGSFMVDVPSFFLAGEKGREHVQITPENARHTRDRGPSVVFNGPVMLDEIAMRNFARTLRRNMDLDMERFAYAR